MRDKARNGGLALLTGSAGALLFWLLEAPLPWMLGAMTATAIASVVGKSWVMPRRVRDFARPVIGILAGSTFTPALLAQAGTWLQVVLVVVAFGVAGTLLGSFYFRKVAGFDRATAFFASTPAGLAEMSLMGEALGGNIRALFLVHSIRVIAVVLCVPLLLQLLTGADLAAVSPSLLDQAPGLQDWLILGLTGAAGYWIGRRTAIPNGIMIVCMVLSAILHVADVTRAAPPAWLIIFVQIVIGCIAGARFAGVTWHELRSTALHGVIWAAILLVATFVVASLATWLVKAPLSALVLALAPGGMVEMTLVTYALGIEVALVVTCQILRNFSTMLLAPLVWRLSSGRPSRPHG